MKGMLNTSDCRGQGTVLAAQPGLYELRFAFYYSVAGADREHRSEAILIYSDE